MSIPLYPLFLECQVICLSLNTHLIVYHVMYFSSETWTLTKRDRKQLDIFERQIYRRILDPVYDNEKENWRILTNKEIYARVKKNLL